MYSGPSKPQVVRRALFAWWRANRRDLPWRRTRDGYAVLVSELMLQQTQVARVVPAYERFMRRFPTLQDLAAASLADVLREWSGLGYNRRARDLHRIARANYALPCGVAALDALPGVGAYTAGAVACFASGERVAFADTNIRRVLGRVFLGRVATEREAVALDAGALPRRRADGWHHALMDLGATVCVARAPRCGACPLRSVCAGPGQAPRRARRPSFGPSDRRVRGAIVRTLASMPHASIGALETAVGDARVPRLVAALIAEGLVEPAGRGAVRLPLA